MIDSLRSQATQSFQSSILISSNWTPSLAKVTPLNDQKAIGILGFAIYHSGGYFFSPCLKGLNSTTAWLSGTATLSITNRLQSMDLKVSLVRLLRYTVEGAYWIYMNNDMLILVRYNSDQQWTKCKLWPEHNVPTVFTKEEFQPISCSANS